MFVDFPICLSPLLRCDNQTLSRISRFLSPTGGNRNHASCSKQGASPFQRQHHPSQELTRQVCAFLKMQSGIITNAISRIPLNDDMVEKAARIGARQAQYDRQMSQIKAAVKTPMPPRRYTAHDRDGSESPGTPRGSSHRGRGSDVNGRGVTPMKRVPILANFEEWMKMATDNKINANNSWNFALIDYFHDMSLLKEGDGVNFQKASCTLDGCVKIYTSRVDSVATETGRLLSGLADSRDKRGRDNDAEGEEGDEDEEGEDGAPRKSRKKVQ